MDIKYIGSGTAAMAMVEYVTNYIAKLSLDSSTVFSSLCAAVKAITEKPAVNPITNQVDNSEQSRLFLLKSCNSLIGKNELSDQQVSSFLCGIPNHYTNHVFDKLWWSSILRFVDPTLFCDSSPIDVDNLSDPSCDPSNSTLCQEDDSLSEDPFISLESVIHNKCLLPPKIPCGTNIDMIYQPNEFEHIHLWDIFSNYKKVKIPKHTKKPIECVFNSTLSDTDDNIDIRSSPQIFRFLPAHPQFLTHCYKKRPLPITPVIMG